MLGFDIIKPINQSNKTSVESFVKSTCISWYEEGFTIEQYIDSNNNNRFVIMDNNAPVSAILFDDTNTCLYRETLINYRGQKLQLNLWLFVACVLDDVKHSDNLTIDGAKFIK